MIIEAIGQYFGFLPGPVTPNDSSKSTSSTTDIDTMASTLTYISFEDQHPQSQSPLFQLPGEVRQNIYHYALSSYQDTIQPYDKNTYWFRPEYLAPQRCDTALLLTCKRVYDESWHVPWVSMDHTFWLTNEARAPDKRMSKERFAQALNLIYSMHGAIDFNHVRFFAQLYMLEPGESIGEFLHFPHFRPKCVTVTLRHTDWWHWELDHKLRVAATWVNDCEFPDSVTSVRLELESLERKKAQVESIVEQMREKWRFRRADGLALTARHTPLETRQWKGSSTWHGQRWVRDETEAETLSYYVATITFNHEPTVTVSTAHCPHLYAVTTQSSIISHRACLQTAELESARVNPGTPADRATFMIDDFYRRAMQASGRRSLFRLGTGVPPS